jgi:hypothetical protein
MEKGRVDEFKAEVSGLKIRTGSARRDGVLQIVGIVLMIVGIVVDLLAYESSRNMSDPRDVQSEIILAVGFLAVAGAGGVVFLYASLARFLRFWLLRQIYESRSQVDQVVAAFQPRSALSAEAAKPATAGAATVGAESQADDAVVVAVT